MKRIIILLVIPLYVHGSSKNIIDVNTATNQERIELIRKLLRTNSELGRVNAKNIQDLYQISDKEISFNSFASTSRCTIS